MNAVAKGPDSGGKKKQKRGKTEAKNPLRTNKHNTNSLFLFFFRIKMKDARRAFLALCRPADRAWTLAKTLLADIWQIWFGQISPSGRGENVLARRRVKLSLSSVHASSAQGFRGKEIAK